MKTTNQDHSKTDTRLKGIPVFITAKMVQQILDVSSSTAYRNLNAAKAGSTRKNGKVTFQEFADHLEIPLEEVYQRINNLKATG